MIDNYGQLNFMEILKEAEKYAVQYPLEKTVIADQNKQVGLTFAPSIKDSKMEKVTASVGEPDADNYFSVTAHINKLYSTDPITKEKRESETSADKAEEVKEEKEAFDAFAVAIRVANAALNTMYTAAMVSPEIVANKDKLIFVGDTLASLLLTKDNGLDVNTYNEIMNGMKNVLSTENLRSIGLANDNIAKFNALRQEMSFYDSIRNRVLKNGYDWAKLCAKTLKEDTAAADISSVRIQPTGVTPVIKKNSDVTPKSLNTQDSVASKVIPIV